MKSRGTLVLVICAAVGASGAFAQAPQPASDAQKQAPASAKPADEKKAPPQAEAQPPSAAGGVVVFIDPVTKQIRQPDAAEIGALLPKARPVPAAPLVTKSLPGGGVEIVLDSSFDSYAVATKTPDGQLVMDCVTGDSKSAETVSAGAQVPQKKTDSQEVLDVQ
jgi:hypothetical protein